MLNLGFSLKDQRLVTNKMGHDLQGGDCIYLLTPRSLILTLNLVLA